MIKNFTDLTGRKAIVTGAAQGLSYGMAEGLMEAGAEVAILDLNPKVKDVAAEFVKRGYKCHGVIVNLGIVEDRTRAFNEALAALGDHLDIIV
ncbi:MAG: SDR family NAD(P)-dependent oxidoreductase, partial [Hungatella sp.]